MPRTPDETTIRRALKQTIMWVVLAGTVGAAALVDRQASKLGPPLRFDGITLQLPRDLAPTRDHDGERLVELRERGGHPYVVRTFTVRRVAFSIRSLFRGAPVRTEQFTLADDVAAKISVVANHVASDPETGESLKELEVLAVFTPPDGEPLLIGIKQLTFGERSEGQRNVRLLKRILQTVRFVKDEG
jgi:hypothetical protein